jgi:hypothetical protein
VELHKNSEGGTCHRNRILTTWNCATGEPQDVRVSDSAPAAVAGGRR